MKNINIFILGILSILAIHNANAQNWQWSKQIGGKASERYPLICSDSSNNVYVTGVYKSDTCYFPIDTLTFDPFYGTNNFFLTKFDANGNEIWVKGFGGGDNQNYYERIHSIVYNKSTNAIYIGGSFIGKMIMDTVTVTNYGNTNAFIAKFNSSGHCLWARNIGKSGDDDILSMDVNQNGEIIANCLLYSNTIIDTSSVNAGSILIKLNSNGECMWAKRKFKPNNTYLEFDAFFQSIKTYKNDAYAFGASSVDNFVVDGFNINANNYGRGKYMIAKMDSEGTILWIKSCGSEFINAGSLAVDTNGNCYVTSSFDSIGIFGNDTIHKNPNVALDLFLAKYDLAGQYLWVRQVNPTWSAAGESLDIDRDQSVLISGSLTGSATFGNYYINNGAYGYSSFIANYDQVGNCIGVKSMTNSGSTSICATRNGSINFTAAFQDTCKLDSNTQIISHINGADILVAQLSSFTTSINENSRLSNNKLIIYANPNKGSCNVSIPDDFLHEQSLLLKISDNSGKLIQQTIVQIHDGKLSLNIEAEAKGMYNVTLSNGRKMYYGKIIFE